MIQTHTARGSRAYFWEGAGPFAWCSGALRTGRCVGGGSDSGRGDGPKSPPPKLAPLGCAQGASHRTAKELPLEIIHVSLELC